MPTYLTQLMRVLEERLASAVCHEGSDAFWLQYHGAEFSSSYASVMAEILEQEVVPKAFKAMACVRERFGCDDRDATIPPSVTSPTTSSVSDISLTPAQSPTLPVSGSLSREEKASASDRDSRASSPSSIGRMLDPLPPVESRISESDQELPVVFAVADGTACFEESKVEGNLFKIHRHFLQQHSDFFRGIFKKYPCSFDRTFVLSTNIKSTDFERFLGVLYPTLFNSYDAHSEEEWVSILAIATEFSFNSVRDLAARELSPLMSPVKKLYLAHRYRYGHWLEDAYLRVCTRGFPLDKEEARLLGDKLSAKISTMIKRVNSPAFMLLTSTDIVALIRDTFDIPESLWTPQAEKDPLVAARDDLLLSLRRFIEKPATDAFAACVKGFFIYPGFQAVIRDTFDIPQALWDPRSEKDPRFVARDHLSLSLRRLIEKPATDTFVACVKSLFKDPGFQIVCVGLLLLYCSYCLSCRAYDLSSFMWSALTSYVVRSGYIENLASMVHKIQHGEL